MKQARRALVDDHAKTLEALATIRNSVDWYRTAGGAVSRDDMVSMLRETLAEIDKVRSIIVGTAGK